MSRFLFLGEYETIDGKYKEKISYFSRDNNRVGIELIFDYKLKGFPNFGALTFKYKNGTTGIATYAGTNNTQFLSVTGITTTIKDTELIKQNTYAYAMGKADATAGVTTDGFKISNKTFGHDCWKS